MKYLITGGSGFIGSAMVRHIIKSSDNQVVNIDSLTYASNLEAIDEIKDSSRYIFENVDICDKQKIEEIFYKHKPDYILHFAAESHVDNSISEPEVFIETNVFGTYSLLMNATKYYESLEGERKKIFRFLHVSTDEVYGDLTDDDSLFNENTKYAPSSPYSASKASSDHFVRAWGRTYKLPILITNCSNNYGPFQHDEKLIPTVINNILNKNRIPIYGKGENIRDWLYVQDHIEAILCVLESSDTGSTYNIGGNNQNRNIDLVNHICKIMDRKIPIIDNSIKTYCELIEYVEDRPGHDFKYGIDASKIKNDLGWTPKESFNTGIEKTINWYIDNKFLKSSK